tara:strand:+ start:33 stop:482 length:450 start_codon:yes stop_codon:yes gene_type:complete
MLLGFSSFAELPISTAGPDNSVTFTVAANTFSISIGNPEITADAIVEDVTANPLTLGLGTVTFQTDANLTATANPLTLGTGIVTVTAGANVYPSGNSVVISSGTVTITGDANVTPTGAPLTLSAGTIAAITWSEIQPGATMIWTPIDPT